TSTRYFHTMEAVQIPTSLPLHHQHTVSRHWPQSQVSRRLSPSSMLPQVRLSSVLRNRPQTITSSFAKQVRHLSKFRTIARPIRLVKILQLTPRSFLPETSRHYFRSQMLAWRLERSITMRSLPTME